MGLEGSRADPASEEIERGSWSAISGLSFIPVLIHLALAFAAVIFVLGVYLLLTARPRRPELAERLAPYQPTIADEAETWLRRQG